MLCTSRHPVITLNSISDCPMDYFIHVYQGKLAQSKIGKIQSTTERQTKKQTE